MPRHHDDSWLSGGETNFDKARLLCPKHHARIHDPGFGTTIHPDNQVTFHMRT
ncbi:hypothetical protein [Nocardioides sp. IC4_145]|uniref:hypothetical protein n=1 Tax=Nocardioides sp. IC4_145 TaxID=2714037 RepID=UPI001F623C7B|nr:hypothetical protein [Nocardioides sp. IC4_145]